MHQANRREASPNRPRGFTLVEALLSLTVLGVLVALAAPALSGLLAHRRMEGLTEGFRQHFQWARSHAVSTGQAVRLRIEASSGGSCYVVFTGAKSSCSCATAGPPCGGDGHLLAMVQLPQHSGIRISTTGLNSQLLIDPLRGTVTPTMTAVFSSPTGTSVHQVINLMGRTYPCSPNGATASYRACPDNG